MHTATNKERASNMPIIANESNADYHANSAISSSQAKLALTSMQLLKDSMDGLIEKKESPAMAFGTAVHAAVLEPDLFVSEYVTAPEDLDGRTKEGKAWKAAHADKAILSTVDSRRIHLMLERMPKDIYEDLTWYDKELTVRVNGVQCRFDAIKTDRRMALDLKTVDNLNNAQKQIGNFLYWFSAGWYNYVFHKETGKTLADWSWLFAETNPPFRWQIIRLPIHILAQATELAEETAKNIEAAQTFGNWSGDDLPTIEWEPKPWDLPLLNAQ